MSSARAAPLGQKTTKLCPIEQGQIWSLMCLEEMIYESSNKFSNNHEDKVKVNQNGSILLKNYLTKTHVLNCLYYSCSNKYKRNHKHDMSNFVALILYFQFSYSAKIPRTQYRELDT